MSNPFTAKLKPALEAYAASTGLGDPALDDCVVSDLLSDLRHWCDIHDWDFGILDRRGYNHYMHEAHQLKQGFNPVTSDLAPATAGDDQ
jgi:hypothetical protein